MMKLTREDVIKYTLDLQEEELIPGALRILCFSKPIYDDLNSDELLDAVHELRHRSEYRAIAGYIYRRWMKIDYPHRNVEPEPIVPRPNIVVTPKKFVPRPSPLVTNAPTEPVEKEYERKDFEMELRKELAHQLIYEKQVDLEDDLEVSDDDDSESSSDRTITELDSDSIKDKQDEYFEAALEDMMSSLGVSSLQELEELEQETSSTSNDTHFEISCIQGTSFTDTDFCIENFGETSADETYLSVSYNEEEDDVMNTGMCESFNVESESEDQANESEDDELNQNILELEDSDTMKLFKSSRYYERYVRA